MHQLTLRIPEELAERLKRAAAEATQSVNGYAGAVLAAAVDPNLAGDEAAKLRERLARAGLLTSGGGATARPPDAADLERARGRAGRGQPLSKLVSEDRR